MPLPYYVSPEQMMKDKAEYARKGISRGRSLVTLEYGDGILLVAEVGDANGSRNEIYHILYDGTIEDERNYAAMGGQSDEIRRFLKDHYQEGMALGDALQLGVRALTVTQNKTLTERDLEVAVLDRTKARRKFRRIPVEALGQLLGAAK